MKFITAILLLNSLVCFSLVNFINIDVNSFSVISNHDQKDNKIENELNSLLEKSLTPGVKQNKIKKLFPKPPPLPNTIEKVTSVFKKDKKGFYEELSLSFGLNFFSEIGDKSFFSIILIYDQISPFILFFVASFCEILMNFFSVVIGYEMRSIPRMKILCEFAGMVTAIIFSILIIYEVLYPEEEKMEGRDLHADSDIEKPLEILPVPVKYNNHIKCKEKGTQKSKFSLFIKIANISWIIFLSEFGDKSQITTIILSTEYHPLSIFLGTALAHVLGIILSMTIGYIIAKNSNKTIIAIIGSICFLYFGIEIGVQFYASGGFKALFG